MLARVKPVLRDRQESRAHPASRVETEVPERLASRVQMGHRDRQDRVVRGVRTELGGLKVPQRYRAQLERGAIREPRELSGLLVRRAPLGWQPSRPRLG